MNSSFWNIALQQLFSEASARETGLAGEEAEKRLHQFGYNEVSDSRRIPLWLQFLAHFRNPLVIMLLVAAILSLLTGDKVSFILITAMVLLSVLMDFIQEVRAENGINALRRSVAVNASVLRDGKMQIIPVRQVVPGDIVHLAAGDLIPADGRLITVKDLYVNQAMLTGESYPEEKHALDLPKVVTALSEATNSVFMGTSVISGTAAFLVIHTGRNTSFGKIAGSLAQKQPPTSFETGIQQFGILIMRVAVLMLLCVVLINLMFHRPLLESFLFALALAVGLTPELLPMIMTVTLTRGALDLARKRAVVKHLPAMHNLGAMDVLCTDKTGTLTEAKISLIRHLDTSWQESERVFELAWLNSHFESGLKGPLDDAILEHGQPDVSAWKKIDEVPFDFNRRRVSVLLEKGLGRILIVKGAPEDILKLCNSYETSDRVISGMDEVKRNECNAKFAALGEEGLRVLAIAYHNADPTHNVAAITDETSLIFSGFTVFLDPPKLDAAEELRQLAEAGVQVKVLTGDNERVTSHVCTLLGIGNQNIITGDQISGMTDEALRVKAREANLFCRVNPQQKQRVILALKASGLVVGFLGDGINDATALHTADVGISVDSAADVAKEAADVILLDHSLSVIHQAVMHGRRTVVNVSKYILMASSANFGNMFSMAVGTLLLPFLPMSPIQILLGNLLYDISQTALPFDNVDAEVVARPLHWDIGFIRRFMILIGPIASLFDFITFYLLLYWFGANEMLFHSGWFVESLAPQMLTIFSIRTRKRLFTSWPHKAVAMLAIGISALVMILPFTPAGTWLGLVPLPPLFFAFIMAVTVSYFTLLEIVKYWFYKKFG